MKSSKKYLITLCNFVQTILGYQLPVGRVQGIYLSAPA